MQRPAGNTRKLVETPLELAAYVPWPAVAAGKDIWLINKARPRPDDIQGELGQLEGTRITLFPNLRPNNPGVALNVIPFQSAKLLPPLGG